MDLMKNEYRYNSNFRKFVDEYCKKNKLSIKEAFDKSDVRKMFWRYVEV